MKGCEVSKDIVIGAACRRIPGTGPGSCYLLREVRDEDRDTVGDLRLLVKRTSGCPFQQDALKRIREQSGAGNFLDIVQGMLMMPQTTRRLVEELGRLNDNLEGLAPTLNRIPQFSETADGLTDAVRDLRTMAARLLGWKVVGKE